MIDKLKTCRCCLSQSLDESDLYEFSSEVSMDSDTQSDAGNFVKISECFKQLTGSAIPVEAEDTSKICTTCLGDLKFCFIFQKKCWDNEKAYNESPKEDNQPEYIEYVEEDCNGQQDENTNDGFEEEYCTSETDTLKAFDFANSSDVPNIEISFPCDLCDKVFNRKDLYQRHFLSSHLSDSAGRKADRQSNAEKSDESPDLNLYQCEPCGKISVSKEEHELHAMEHSTEELYKCKKCNAKFVSKDVARLHLKTAHSNDDKTLACEHCPKTFKSRYQLVIHNRSHTGEKPFACHICNRCFSMSSNLQKHLDTHNSDKPHTCNICDQSFKTQRSLKFHTVCYHRPEEKVKCNLCDKTFVNRSYLKMHTLYHTGEKNYTCVVCHSKYYKTSHLKRHVQNVHFKLRLMKCEFCASDFVRKETYKAHVTSQHKRHLSPEEYEEVMTKIKNFQPPSLNVADYCLESIEKQRRKNREPEIEFEGTEVVEETHKTDEEIEMETDEYYEDEIFEDEQ